jgi:hypothetical protein
MFPNRNLGTRDTSVKFYTHANNRNRNTYKRSHRTLFDLSRSIDFHIISTRHTGEKAVEGVTTGLISGGDTVTFQAKHLGFKWKLTSRIVEFENPYKFTDEMLKGPFKRLRHEHIFEEHNGKTIMIDRMEMESPAGIAGKAFDRLVLTDYMRKFLKQRCDAVKECLESGEWRKYV